MADDMYLGIIDDSQHTLCILVFITTLPTIAMDACYGDIQTVKIIIIKIQTSIRVEDVDFTTHQQPDAIHLPWHHKHVPEIYQRTGSGNTRSMLCYTQYL